MWQCAEDYSEQHTLGVGRAPKNDRPVPVLLGTEYVVKPESEPVEVTYVEGAEIVVESIVEQFVIDGEVVRLLAGLEVQSGNGGISSALRSLRGRSRWWSLGVGEESVFGWRVDV